MKTDDMVAVLRAKDKGEVIEQTIIGGTAWQPMQGHNFDFSRFIYRVVEKPKVIYGVYRGDMVLTVSTDKTIAETQALRNGGRVIKLQEVM